MGNGSPRLLSRFLRRTALVALGALYFAPSAFADDAVVSVSVNAGPIAPSVAVELPTAAVRADPPAAPVTPVASPLPSANPPVQATLGAKTSTAPVAVGTTHAVPGSAATTPAERTPRKLLSSNKKPAHQRAAALGAADSSRIGASVRGPFPEVARAGSPVREPAPRVPQAPAPAPSGLGLAGSNGTGSAPAFGFLLLALAAALAIARAPTLGRRVSLLLTAPRPHAHLLQLERPD
jgi:hypothetical protein